MAFLSKDELAQHALFVVTRTQRGDDLISRDPRQMPRRLRVLLLAIDGAQSVQLYTQTLKGFGDVSELLIELIHLGMVKLIDPQEAKRALMSGKSSAATALDQMMDDGRFTSESAAQVLYGNTTPGSFDELVRVAQTETPQYQPPSAPTSPAVASAAALGDAVAAAQARVVAAVGGASSPPKTPVAANPPTALTTDQTAQIQSLFDLLEAVRGERVNLKQQVGKLLASKDAASKLEHKYEELKNALQRLQNNLKIAWTVCGIFAVISLVLAYLLFKR